MKRRRIHSWLWTVIGCLSLCLAAGCTDGDTETDVPGTGGETPAGGVWLGFSLSSRVSTRTVLQDSTDVQHVDYVHLYIFDGTDGNAVCVASEDVQWKAYFAGVPPEHNAEMNYHVQYDGFEPGRPYTFVVVGVDSQQEENGKNCFGVPGFMVLGQPLTDRPEAGWADGIRKETMQRSELFVGSEVLVPDPNGYRGEIVLYRRMAGVMGCFTNVPSSVNGKEVKYLNISLYRNQNTRVPLLPLDKSPVFLDYTDSPVPGAEVNPDQPGRIPADPLGHILVQMDVQADADRKELTDDEGRTLTVFSKGSFVLPVAAPIGWGPEVSTLRVDLTDGEGNVLCSRRVKLSQDDKYVDSTQGGMGFIDTEATACYPIMANHFYGIGWPTRPVDMGGDSEIIINLDTSWDRVHDDGDVTEENPDM